MKRKKIQIYEWIIIRLTLLHECCLTVWRTSSLIRVSTAALSISLSGILSWDSAAKSGASLLVTFVVWLMDISLCGTCREHTVCSVQDLRRPSKILTFHKQIPYGTSHLTTSAVSFSFRITLFAGNAQEKQFILKLILLIKHLYTRRFKRGCLRQILWE